MRHWPWGLLLALSMALPSCGKTDSKQSGGSSQSVVKTGAAALKRYAAEELPPVEAPLPLLDNGRVELSPPQGWRLLPRDITYLVRLVKGEGDNSLPRLTVKVEEGPKGVADVTEENAEDFCAEMEKRSATVAGRKVIEPERPIIVGELAWARHVRHLRARSSSSGHAAVQSLTTARGGKLYIIELTVESAGEAAEDFAKAILSERDAAYALAAHWKFTGEAAKPAESSPAKESPAGAAAAKGDSEANPSPADSQPEKNPD